MTKVQLPAFIEEIHGRMYAVVFKRSPKGHTIVTQHPWDVAVFDYFERKDLLSKR